LADTGDVQEALDTRETQAVGSGEEEGGGAFAVGDDQFGDVALIETLAVCTDASRSVLGAHTGVGEGHGVAKSQVSSLR
jgi:hypothetical protein